MERVEIFHIQVVWILFGSFEDCKWMKVEKERELILVEKEGGGWGISG